MAEASAQTPATASDLDTWWLRFSDPTLNLWVEQALAGNLRITAAEAAWREAQAWRDVAQAALGPQLDLQASAGRDSQGRGNGQSVTRQIQLGAQASWAPDLAGTAGQALAAAQATVSAQQARWGDVRVQVASEVALAYIGLLAQGAQAQLAMRTVASQRQTLQLADWRQQAGLVSALETDQARTALAQTEALLPELQTAMQQSRHALALLAGRPPGDAGPQPGAPAAEAAAPAKPTTPTVPLASEALTLAPLASVLLRRADVSAAAFDVQAAQALVGQAEAQRRPSLSLSAGGGLSALTLHALGDSASLLTSLLASVRLTLFDGGAGLARVRAQSAALDQAQVQHHATALGALRDVEDALVGLRGERARSQALQAAASLAERTAALALERFSSGLVDLRTVLETQRTAYSLQDAAVGAQADLARGQVRLFQALGGGWRPGPWARPTGAAAASSTTNLGPTSTQASPL
jgi:NodT family efflux transporter outer membrane factor (OMF) lipoprotein